MTTERRRWWTVVVFVAAGLWSAVASGAEREALFGDLHMHTWWSFDAYSLGVRVGPEDAYRFARGGAVDHVSGVPAQLNGPPLDFMALTEHAEYMGVSVLASQPDHPIRRLPLIADLTSDDPDVRATALGRFAQILSGSEPIAELLTDAVVQPVWQRIVALAEEHNDPGTFTAFVGYEWTSMPDGQNIHRNVVFAGSDVPARPFSSIDSANPEDLWAWMDRVRAEGSDVIAIPHNGNTSNGLMYPLVDWSGDPIDAPYADLRMRNEPVSEVFQIKGQSETHPALSPADEWAGFEQFDRVLGRMTESSRPDGSFVRRALQAGLRFSGDGFNPYQFGVVGSSDGHNATSPTEEANYTGKIGIADGTAAQRLQSELSAALPLEAVSRWGAAGLAGVWAEANTREAIFAALRRRETFATSGPRLRARFFGGWSFAEADLSDLVDNGYARGVPMGGELVGQQGVGPAFLFSALKDPAEAPLERVQVVKLWDDGETEHEQIIDVACAGQRRPVDGRCPVAAPEPGNGSCAVPADRGAAELSGVWQDPDYDPTLPAAYYLRVLQVPTCRWSTYDARTLGIELPAHLPRTLQERLVTSAIWIHPAAR